MCHLLEPEKFIYRIKDASLFNVALSKDLRRLIMLCYGMWVEEISSMKIGLNSLLINTSKLFKSNNVLFQTILQVSNIEKLHEIGIFVIGIYVIEVVYQKCLMNIFDWTHGCSITSSNATFEG